MCIRDRYKYLLPRLLGMWTHLERQEGAIGTRGPGETQLETDRRHIHRKIAKLEDELRDVRRVRATQRERRIKNEVPVVAIVGYTNAGKSTLLNKLTGAEIPANNRLFDTLDTTTRTLEISDTCTAVSYTHLDVYKRQGLYGSGSGHAAGGGVHHPGDGGAGRSRPHQYHSGQTVAA